MCMNIVLANKINCLLLSLSLDYLPPLNITSCARGDTVCLRPLQVDNIFAVIHQVALLFRHNNIFVYVRQVAPVPACWLFKTSATSWPLTLKVVSESRVTLATSVPILVFLGLSVLELGPMYARDRQIDVRQTYVGRQTDVRQKYRLMPPPYGGGGIIIVVDFHFNS